MSIKLNINTKSFEKLLTDIEAAGGTIESACDKTVRGSAAILQSELKSEMRKSNVPSDLVNAMPSFDVETEGNITTARVGYRKGAYDPDNPSDGYKVVFLNYGTPNRRSHGKIKEGSKMKGGGTLSLGFIQRAKENAKPKMRKQQRQALKTILRRLKK